MTPDDTQRLFASLERLENGQERLARGMYGDPENGVPGVVREVAGLKESRDQVNRKIVWLSGVASGSGAFIALAIKKLFHE